MRYAKWVLGLTAIMALHACGGGGSAIPSVQATDSAQVDNLNAKYDFATQSSTAQATAGVSSDSLAAVFERMLSAGSAEMLADMHTTEQRQAQLSGALSTSVASNVEGFTTVTITEAVHGLRDGDQVTVRNIDDALSVFGILGSDLNGLHTVQVSDRNTYSFQVAGEANASRTWGGSFAVDYVMDKCRGVYDIRKSPVAVEADATPLQGYEVFRAVSVVAIAQANCSPAFQRDNATTQFYQLTGGLHQLVAQMTGDGAFLRIDGDWQMPTEALASGAPETVIARLGQYAKQASRDVLGYSTISYRTEADTASSVFLLLMTRNYSLQEVLLSTETQVYADAGAGYQLVKSFVVYNNRAQTRVSIGNYRAIPAYPDDGVDRASLCADLLYLTCMRDYPAH